MTYDDAQNNLGKGGRIEVGGGRISEHEKPANRNVIQAAASLHELRQPAG
jgi:hypothetical protein